MSEYYNSAITKIDRLVWVFGLEPLSKSICYFIFENKSICYYLNDKYNFSPTLVKIGKIEPNFKITRKKNINKNWEQIQKSNCLIFVEFNIVSFFHIYDLDNNLIYKKSYLIFYPSNINVLVTQ